MRTIPGMVILNPCDHYEMQAAVRAAVEHKGPCYIRLGRLAVESINNNDDYKFELGKGITLREGVYCWMNGPTYESPAEIRMARILGGDAVGMSTVPETIVARHSGMDVLGLSCITNMAAGILDQPLTHQEVMETGERVKDTFRALVDGVIAAL